MRDIILRVSHLKVWFNTEAGTAKAVNDISFDLAEGEKLAIVGESGCGKSVTALSMLKLLKKDVVYHPPGLPPGSILFHNDDILQADTKKLQEIRGNRISMIFQEPMTSLNPVHTIGSQLLEPLLLHQGLTRDEADNAGIQILKSMGIPAPEQVMKAYPHQLSGGMKQRVMIGMALACKPELLIADEPTTALDVTIQAQILRLIKELGEERQMALILITHDLGIVSEVADRIIVMYGGRIMETGSTDDIFNNPKHPYTRALLKSRPTTDSVNRELYTIPGMVEPATAALPGCRFAKRCRYAADYCSLSLPSETVVDVSADLNIDLNDDNRIHNHTVYCFMYEEASRPHMQSAINSFNEPDEAQKIAGTFDNVRDCNTLMKIENLQVWFPVYKGWLKRVSGHVRAVDRFSIDVQKGRTLGLVGESGCGKTTLGQSLVRLVNPTGGKIIFHNQSSPGTATTESVLEMQENALKNYRRKVQMVFQDPFSSLSPSMLIGDIVGEGLKVHNMVSGRQEFDKKVKAVLEEVGLDPAVRFRYPHQFSGGQRQRISLARGLVINPEMIILDESTSALDVSVQAQILNLLKALQQKKNLTFLFISHDLAVIEYLADNVAVMYLGRIVETGSRAEIFNNPQHPYTVSLMDAVPKTGKRTAAAQPLTGDVPSPIDPPSGCYFHPRCPMQKRYGIKKCKSDYPPERALSETHKLSCWGPARKNNMR